MKKVSVFVVLVGLLVSLVGCSVPEPVADSGTVPIPSSSAAQSETSEASVSGEKPTQSSEAEPTTSSEPARPASSSGTGGTTSGSQPGGSSSQAQPPASSQAPGTSPPPASSQPPAQPPASSQPPAAPQPPAEPPAEKTAYDAPYNTDTIIADAQSYGASLGMTWSDGLNKDNCSWEAPIMTSTVLCGSRLKEAIESGIRRVQKLQQDNGYQPGEFHFRLYLEASGGEYSLYFLMG